MLYRLIDDVLYRKEVFGSIIFNRRNRRYHHFNRSASEVIEQCVLPSSSSDIAHAISEKERFVDVSSENVASFLEYLTSIGLLVEMPEGSRCAKSGAEMFFVEREIFPKNYLASPTTVALYVTYKCHRHCRHCISDANSETKNGLHELSTKEWFRIIDTLKSKGVVQLVITGGEPFFRKDLVQILDYADRCRFRMFVLTEAGLLNEGLVRSVVALKHLDQLQISMDGHTAELHDFIRGEGAFATLMSKLQILKDAGVKFTTATLMHRENYLYLPEIAKLAKETGAGKLWITPLTPFGRGRDINDLVLSNEQLAAVSREYCQLIRDGIVEPANDFWKIASQEQGSFGGDFNPLKDNPFEFSRAIYTLSIDPSGNCYVDSKSRSLDVLALGNILTNDFDSIWHNSVLEGVRKGYEFGDWTFFDYLGKIAE